MILEEAGGRITTCRGAPLPLAKTSLAASDGLVHDAVLGSPAKLTYQESGAGK